MPMAARLGRKLPMIGLALLLAGAAATTAVVTRYGIDLWLTDAVSAAYLST